MKLIPMMSETGEIWLNPLTILFVIPEGEPAHRDPNRYEERAAVDPETGDIMLNEEGEEVTETIEIEGEMLESTERVVFHLTDQREVVVHGFHVRLMQKVNQSF